MLINVTLAAIMEHCNSDERAVLRRLHSLLTYHVSARNNAIKIRDEPLADRHKESIEHYEELISIINRELSK